MEVVHSAHAVEVAVEGETLAFLLALAEKLTTLGQLREQRMKQKVKLGQRRARQQGRHDGESFQDFDEYSDAGCALTFALSPAMMSHLSVEPSEPSAESAGFAEASGKCSMCCDRWALTQAATQVWPLIAPLRMPLRSVAIVKQFA